MSNLTLGKLRGIQQIANENSIFTILAMDHRGSLQRQLATPHGGQATYQDMVEFKTMMSRLLSPHASATLLDPEFGAAQSIATNSLTGHKGLLVSLEATGYEGDPTARKSGFLANWSIEKTKRMGASAVKMLLYYNRKSPTAAEQEALVKQAVAECREYDIPFLLETVTYNIKEGEDKGTLVIESARWLAPLGVDIYKSEFPGTLEQSDDELLNNCCRLTETVGDLPWVLLTAGVDWEAFRRQAKIAMRGGASGFLAGRAIWKECTAMSPTDREAFVRETAVARFKELVSIAENDATPWTERHKVNLTFKDGWYSRY